MSADFDAVMEKAALRAEVLKVVAGVRDDTVRICADCIESLLADKQGLDLDDATIRACASIIRKLISPPQRGSDD